MGWVNPAPPLNAGEQIRWKQVALHSLETTTASGTLYVTTTDLLFMPNKFSGRFKDWGLSGSPSNRLPMSGSRNARVLRITEASGAESESS
jgi:hypothetical protein